MTPSPNSTGILLEITKNSRLRDTGESSGIWVPNEIIAEYVAEHPDKIEGWASVDPTQPDCIEQLEHAVKVLKLKGLKLGPVYQHFDPQDRKYWPLFRKCQEFGLPICGTRALHSPAPLG